MLNGITQFYLPTTRFIPTEAEQDLERNPQRITKRKVTDLVSTSEGWNAESSYLPGRVEPLNCMAEYALESVHKPTKLARQTVR